MDASLESELPRRRGGQGLAMVALFAGNAALALGPWLFRLSEVGPAAAGFWRMSLGLPFMLLFARLAGQPVRWPGRALAVVIAIAAFFFAADIASWHAGIQLTKLGNATLFGNVSSFAFAAWGLWLARRWPTTLQAIALGLAALGCALLMVGSAELSARHVRGDLLALFAGVLYTGYLIGIERVRGQLKPLSVLFFASLFGAVFLLLISLALGEQIIPGNWTGVVLLALSSQVIGQGLIIYALGVVPPLIVGLAFLTQPAISALVGWLVYREALTPLDFIGAAAIGGALVLVSLRRGDPRPS